MGPVNGNGVKNTLTAGFPSISGLVCEQMMFTSHENLTASADNLCSAVRLRHPEQGQHTAVPQAENNPTQPANGTVLILKTTLGSPLNTPCPFPPAVAADHRWWCWCHWESPRWRAWPPQLAPAQSDAGTSAQSWWKCHRPCPARRHESLQSENKTKQTPVKQRKPKFLSNSWNPWTMQQNCNTFNTSSSDSNHVKQNKWPHTLQKTHQQ